MRLLNAVEHSFSSVWASVPATSQAHVSACTGHLVSGLLFPPRLCTSLYSFRHIQPRNAAATQQQHFGTGGGRLARCRAATTAEGAASTQPPAVEAGYEPVIGIEVHVQLGTATKAFCSCANEFGAEPNSHICPVCMGHPGTLPVLNEGMVRRAVAAGLALNCKINRTSKFDRKQYFYADLPKGYQISQYDEPLCTDGHVTVLLPDGSSKHVGITRAHVEEDAGKLQYAGGERLAGSAGAAGLVDYNRAGVPLLEIVSEPDLHSGAEAAAYGQELRRIMRFIRASDGSMAEGSLRCDVNVSVRPIGQAAFGTKVEVKNMNSFSAMQAAIDFEIARQSELLAAGRGSEIAQETRMWDEGRRCTYSMRKKEGLADYRYFPEPDLPPLVLTEEYIAAIAAELPELPAAARQRLLAAKLPLADVLVLADEAETAAYYDGAVAAGAPAKAAANWVMGDLMAYCKENKVGMGALALAPAQLGEMVSLIEDGTISGKIGKELLLQLLAGKAGDMSVREYVEAQGMSQISDPAAVEAIIDAVLAANPGQLEQYRGGKTKLQGFFVGQVMKESGGRVNPGLMNKILMQKLKATQ